MLFVYLSPIIPLHAPITCININIFHKISSAIGFFLSNVSEAANRSMKGRRTVYHLFSVFSFLQRFRDLFEKIGAPYFKYGSVAYEGPYVFLGLCEVYGIKFAA